MNREVSARSYSSMYFSFSYVNPWIDRLLSTLHFFASAGLIEKLLTCRILHYSLFIISTRGFSYAEPHLLWSQLPCWEGEHIRHIFHVQIGKRHPFFFLSPAFWPLNYVNLFIVCHSLKLRTTIYFGVFCYWILHILSFRSLHFFLSILQATINRMLYSYQCFAFFLF